MQIKDYPNVHAILKETVNKYPEAKAYQWFQESNQLASVTWQEFYQEVTKVSKSLMALGVAKGDKINILSYSCYQWVLCDLGIASIGACTVGIYQSNLPLDCHYIINHSDAVVIFVEDAVQLEKILQIREEIPNIRKVILFNGDYEQDDWIIDFQTFLSLGSEISDEDFISRANAVGPQDTAGIVYTSGTTGIPKGAVLTHDNVTFTAQSVRHCAHILEGDETFLFLPLAHIFARLAVYFSLLTGVSTTFTRSMESIIDDIKVARPHWFVSVPRIYEKVYTKVLSGVEAKGGLALKIFRWASAVGNRVSDCKLKQAPVPFLTRLQYKLATKLVFSKILEALGGRVRWCISGAAPIHPEIAKFFHASGVLILEGIGMTENMSFTNVNRFDNYRFGWVGPPGPGIEQKTAEDGEIMYRGRNVMQGYYKMPEETAETLTPDGWQYTGDLGEIDEENFLRITGRKKELIITAGGKNIAPSPLEGVIATSKFINQICIVGDRRKFLSALVTLDMENVKAYAAENNIAFTSDEQLMQTEAVQKLIEDEVMAKNHSFASFETIKRVRIVPEFTIANGLLTPTLKLKKNVIMEQHQSQIDAIYDDV
jgi:long-chain acyl-CoA synthetase